MKGGEGGVEFDNGGDFDFNRSGEGIEARLSGISQSSCFEKKFCCVVVSVFGGELHTCVYGTLCLLPKVVLSWI